MSNEELIITMLKTQSATLELLVSDVRELKQGQAKLEQGFARLEAELAVVKADGEKLKAEVEVVKEHLILIENKHGKRLGGLEDGQVVLLDYARKTNEKIIDITRRDDYRDIRILQLESEMLSG
jgi:hypothetical protein